MKQLIWVAALALVTTACVAEVNSTAGAAGTKPPTPVVTSTSGDLWGDVVTINGYTYNCVRDKVGSIGVAVWCDRVDPHG